MCVGDPLQALVHPLSVAAKSPREDRKAAAEKLMNIMKQNASELVEVCALLFLMRYRNLREGFFTAFLCFMVVIVADVSTKEKRRVARALCIPYRCCGSCLCLLSRALPTVSTKKNRYVAPTLHYRTTFVVFYHIVSYFCCCVRRC